MAKAALIAVTLLALTFGANCAEVETMVFQTEVSRLLDIIINSLYSQKDIFIREAISNASDALDKLRFLSLSDAKLLDEEKELAIRVQSLPEQNQIVLTDTGIGMTRSDLINNLGTIARSGTTQFLEAITKGGNLNLIGQFGVGFYSYFLVADKVTVITKHNEDKQYIWESTAGSTFTIQEDTEGPFLTRGTKIILHLKNDMKEYLEVSKLRELITRYSQFINFPIYLHSLKEVSREVEEEPAPAVDESSEPKSEENKEAEEPKEPEEPKLEEDSNEPVLEESDKKGKKKTITEKVPSWDKVNDAKALWLRPPEEIEDEEYKQFYKTLSNSNEEPLTWLHFKAEGEVEFTALIYIPKKRDFNFMDQDNEDTKRNMKLFVRRVLISDSFDELIPKYLGFVKGIVDSDDLPLNVSREALQQMRVIKTIKKKIVKKILDKLEKLSKAQLDKEEDDGEAELSEAEKKEREERHEAKREETLARFETFYKNFGRSVKIGIVEDAMNKNKIAEIVKFYSTHNSTKTLTNLPDYVSRMPSNQKDIYYFSSDSKEEALKSPLVRGIVSRNFEVLMLEEPTDEYCLMTLVNFKEKKFVNVGKSGFELPRDDDEKDKLKKLGRYYQPLTDWIQKTLSEQIDRVEVSDTLTSDPMIVLAPEGGYSAHFEKIARAQAAHISDDRLSYYDKMKKKVQINPYHPFIKELLERVKASPDADTEQTVKLMFEVALINSGYDLKDQASFASKFYRVLGDSLGVPRDQETVDIDLSELDEPAASASEQNFDELKVDDSTSDAPETSDEAPSSENPADTEL